MPSITVRVPVELEVEIEWGTANSDAPCVERIWDGACYMIPFPHGKLAASILQSTEVADAISSYAQPESVRD